MVHSYVERTWRKSTSLVKPPASVECSAAAIVSPPAPVVLMLDGRLRFVPIVALVLGALLGMAGTFTSSAAVRGLAWGIDGTLLSVAAAMLAVHHLRSGDGTLAAGFIVFLAGETLIVSGSAPDLRRAGRCLPPVPGCGPRRCC